MAESVPWFIHDSNARNDPKMAHLLMLGGQAAKGSYWDLIEILRVQDFYRLHKEELPSIIFQNRFPENAIEHMIKAKLIQDDDEYIWSESLNRRMKSYEEYKQQKAESGRLGGLAKARNAKETASTAKAPLKHRQSDATKKASKNLAKPSDLKGSDLIRKKGEARAPVIEDRRRDKDVPIEDVQKDLYEICEYCAKKWNHWPMEQIRTQIASLRSYEKDLTVKDWQQIIDNADRSFDSSRPSTQLKAWIGQEITRYRNKKGSEKSTPRPQTHQKREEWTPPTVVKMTDEEQKKVNEYKGKLRRLGMGGVVGLSSSRDDMKKGSK